MGRLFDEIPLLTRVQPGVLVLRRGQSGRHKLRRLELVVATLHTSSRAQPVCEALRVVSDPALIPFTSDELTVNIEALRRYRLIVTDSPRRTILEALIYRLLDSLVPGQGGRLPNGTTTTGV